MWEGLRGERWDERMKRGWGRESREGYIEGRCEGSEDEDERWSEGTKRS